MEHILTVEKREQKGTKISKALRAGGKLPAVMYSGGKETELISVPISEFEALWSKVGESTLINLNGLGKDKVVLIQDVDVDPVYDKPIHVDFYEVQTGKVVNVEVALNFVGSSPAEKELGGIFIRVMRAIEIEALPKDLPSEIDVDVSSLKTFEDQLQIKDLKLPEGVSALGDSEEVVALVQEPKEESEDEVPAEEVDLSAVEVEKKGKAEEAGGEESQGEAEA